MQQLTLQFDGYADSRPVIDVSATKPCTSANFGTMIISLLAALPLKFIGECLFAAASVAFCFALMFLAAIIQG